MHFEHFDDKRKDKRKYLRLKIITNRQFNFITAIRPDSTVTDLANRALNAYLELSHQNKTKKQLTVSAVKQGRYFMPKSEIVSNLLSQDEEVEIMIVKAKPKFPEQTIPSQHDFEVLAKQIHHFDASVSKRPSSVSSKIPNLKESIKCKKQEPKIKKVDKVESSVSLDQEDNQLGSKSSSISSQVQHKKRTRKKERKQNKKQQKQLNKTAIIDRTLNNRENFVLEKSQNFKADEFNKQESIKELKYEQKNYQSVQKQDKRQDKHKESEFLNKIISEEQNDSIDIDLMSLITFNEIKSYTPDKIPSSGTISIAEKSFGNVPKSIQKIAQKTHEHFTERSTQKKQRQSSSNSKIPSQSSINPPPKRDFNQSKNQSSQEKLEDPKKKLKLDPSGKYQTQEISISRKGSVDNRSEKTPKVNPLPSPKVVFHFETKHESPKVIYIPESKTMTEMKENIEKEKQKMKTMSPLALPKSSPKITYLQDPLEKIPEKSRGMTSSLSKKNKEQGINERKDSMDEQKPQQVRKERQASRVEPNSPKYSYSASNPSSLDQRRYSSSTGSSGSSLSSDDRRLSSSSDDRRSLEDKRSIVSDEKKPSAMQPQIIQQESSEQENYITINPTGSAKKTDKRQNAKQDQSILNRSQSDESTIKKRSSTSSKFHEVQSMMRKFRLEESDDEEKRMSIDDKW